MVRVASGSGRFEPEAPAKAFKGDDLEAARRVARAGARCGATTTKLHSPNKQPPDPGDFDSRPFERSSRPDPLSRFFVEEGWLLQDADRLRESVAPSGRLAPGSR